MRMRNKLTLILLVTGLLSAGAVGSVAYWLLMRDFQQGVMDHAYNNFQQDIQRYLDLYGGWDEANRQERFTDFVMRHRGSPAQRGPIPGGPPPTIRRIDTPPFRFIVLSPEGIILKRTDGYPEGTKASPDIMQRAKPVLHAGKVEVLLAPIGDPILTATDQEYLNAMRKALTSGIAVAILLALLIGILGGQRISASLGTLTRAIREMQQDREQLKQVPVNSNDELGELAHAFNQMNRELTEAHRGLRVSSEMVQRQAHKLKEQSIRDPLTKLFNRRHYEEQANTLFQQALRYQQPMTVMIGDLDHFKQINDRFSHAIGDQVLCKVAELLTSGIRKSDLLARYGGEEFVILFPNSNLQQAAQCCEHLRTKLEAYPWQELHPDLKVTMSMGLCDQLRLGNIERMIAEADSNLYQAKHQGRNRIIPAVGAVA